jgi:hypothetical protein
MQLYQEKINTSIIRLNYERTHASFFSFSVLKYAYFLVINYLMFFKTIIAL